MKRAVLALVIMLAFEAAGFAANSLYHPDKSGDEALQTLIREKASRFTVKTFSDDVTGLAINYSVYLPDEDGRLPVVFFIADGSAAGKDPEFSLTQGYGALVWPEDCIVIVPAFPEMILDDHDGFVMTSYVELAGRFVRWAVKEYDADASRVYATGQSMGCMTWLVLAAKYPELFTACLFVSGQWDIRQLGGLEGQRFVYVASAGDPKASAGQREVIGSFTRPHVWYRNVDAKDPELELPESQAVSFITFKAGTTLPEQSDKEYSEHMTSFDYAYRMAAVREWLLAQTRGE